MSSRWSAVVTRMLLVLVGLSLGIVGIEMVLSAADLRRFTVRPLEPNYRTYYLFTEIGIGKCYPSNPDDSLRYDLRESQDLERLRSLIKDVSDLPDDWSLAKQIEHLQTYAPFCNLIEIRRLNAGLDRNRPRNVLIVGDSFAFGEGLGVEDTVGYRLAGLLPDVNFSNMAWPGSGIDSLHDVSAPLGNKTEAVIYFYNINDIIITDDLRRRGRGLHHIHRPTEFPENPAGYSATFDRCDSFALCRFLRNRSANRRLSDESVAYYRNLYFSDENRELRSKTFEILGEMNRAVGEQGARFVVVMFPLFYKPPFSDYPFGAIHQLLASETGRRGIEFVDLLPAYEAHSGWGKLTVHSLDRHPSAEAIEIAARYLAERLNL
jgi:hypothetical protein